MMISVAILIGNSDDKLSQLEWSNYIHRVGNVVSLYMSDTHFAGFSPSNAQWQNACWTILINDRWMPNLRAALAEEAKRFNQDSIALVVGQVEILLSSFTRATE